MINARKKFVNVAMHRIPIPFHELLQPPRCRMSPFTHSASKAGRVKMAIQDGLQNIHDRMMNNAIAIRGGGNQPELGPGYPVGVKWPRLVAAIVQLLLNSDQMGFFLEMKALNHRAGSLMSLRFVGRQEEIIPVDDLRPEVTMAFQEDRP